MKDGVLLINKPAGFTSFDVIAKLRGILKERKLGHGGTLDPGVTGVLPIFIGRATKAIDIVPNTDKSYTATFRLGIETETQDIWGNVISQCDCEKDIEKIERAVLSFKGKQKQLPPMYSAIKVNGTRLYDLARQGLNVERQTRDIEIYKISFEGKTENEDEYRFSVSCSKGTYVRTICADIGIKLGGCAVMTSLVRTQSLGYELSQCTTLEEVQKAADEGQAEKLVLGIDSLFMPYPPISLTQEQTKLFLNGVWLDPERVRGVIYDRAYEIAPWQRYRVYNSQDDFISVAMVDYNDRKFKSIKMFWIEGN